MEYPNKIYSIEYNSVSDWGNKYTKVIICVGDNKNTVINEIRRIYPLIKNFDPVWLMNAVYPKIYTQTGQTELLIQFKILYTTTIIQ